MQHDEKKPREPAAAVDVQRPDGRRLRGDQSRRAVLEQAVDLASVGGLDGLSIGGLATAVGASKSGVAALFGSKEQLQLAAIEMARQIVIDTVVAPARETPRGALRLCILVDSWLDYSERRVFPGGCFFLATASEFDSKPGPVRDAIARNIEQRRSYIEACVTRATELGELDAASDARQIAFEILAMYDAANAASLLGDSAEPYAQARRAIASRLRAAGVAEAAVTASGLAAA